MWPQPKGRCLCSMPSRSGSEILCLNPSLAFKMHLRRPSEPFVPGPDPYRPAHHPFPLFPPFLFSYGQNGHGPTARTTSCPPNSSIVQDELASWRWPGACRGVLPPGSDRPWKATQAISRGIALIALRSCSAQTGS